ncbi:MAG: hypothetical protein HUU11_06825 [Anaerolineales bacterium]|nr:hypothetical protein [Anaerolineales bacterium]NUQ84409.1 hypothetical protein [Anaerolineales bacterium]
MNNVDVKKLYGRFFTEHPESIDALSKILDSLPIEQSHVLHLIEALVKLWDDFDADAKDLIIGALKKLSRRVDLSLIPEYELQRKIFANSNRRRLLRDTEIKMLFPQLSSVPLGGYNAKWLLHKGGDDPKITNWLKEFSFVSNPFGKMNLKDFPFYPEGFLPPNKWNDFADNFPKLAQCPSPQDARALALQLCVESLPLKKKDVEGNETVKPGLQVLPILVSFNQSLTIESPLLTLARSAAQTWLDILCLSPDAMLDLLPAEQEAVLDPLCWAFGSAKTVTNLLQREGLTPDKAGSLLLQKIERFQSGFSSAQVPQNTVLLSWLKTRPPELISTFLIVNLDEVPLPAKVWWMEQFNPLISTLFLNGIVVKAFFSSTIPIALSLPEVQLSWSNENLRASLNAQFESAMDKIFQKELGQVIDFQALFGSDPAIGYFATREETTERLISASHNSLARMLTLGNRLFQHHCERRIKNGVPEKYLYVEDLETILKTA